MKRLVLETKSSPNFIGNWNIDDKKLCDEIINFFENNPKLQIKGTTAGGVDEKVKKTTDITINPSDLKNKEYELFNRVNERSSPTFLTILAVLIRSLNSWVVTTSGKKFSEVSKL